MPPAFGSRVMSQQQCTSQTMQMPDVPNPMIHVSIYAALPSCLKDAKLESSKCPFRADVSR